jgi:hypothetical protein
MGLQRRKKISSKIFLGLSVLLIHNEQSDLVFIGRSTGTVLRLSHIMIGTNNIIKQNNLLSLLEVGSSVLPTKAV